MTRTLWRATGASVRGASHIRDNLPKQDSVLWQPADNAAASRIILAVADGHGDAAAFRSEAGSRFAVESALRIQEEACNDFDSSLSSLKKFFEEDFPAAVVNEWRQRVRDDLAENAITEKEREALDPKRQKTIDDNPFYVYGSTLLTVVIDSAFMAFSQLGDGDITYVIDSREAGLLFPENKQLVGGNTESLCLSNAEQLMKTKFQVLSGRPPALVLLATDGYKKSYDSDDDFLQVGKEFLDLLQQHGIDTVSSQLHSWLTSVSEEGCGDDVTLGVVFRDGVLDESPAPVSPQSDDRAIPTPARDDFFASLISSLLKPR